VERVTLQDVHEKGHFLFSNSASAYILEQCEHAHCSLFWLTLPMICKQFC
jgi:hypothetical protein